MIECKHGGMEMQRKLRRVAPAIKRISQNGMANRPEMHPDLMGTTCFQAYGQERPRPFLAKEFHMSYRRLALGHHRPPFTVLRISPDRGGDNEPLLVHLPRYDGKVPALRALRSEL